MLCLRIWGLPLLASALLAQQYPFVPVANSPKNIERILQDGQGRLWMSTHDDVLCFDGTRFFSLREFGLPAVLSYGLAEDTEGGIWSASESGVYRFLRGRLEHVVSGLSVREIVAVAPGLLLAAVVADTVTPTAHLYRVRAVNGEWRAERLTSFEGSYALSRDNTGAILTVCPGGWCELSAKLITDWNPRYTGGPVFHKSELDIQRVVRDRFGCVWFRSIESGAYQCPNDPKPIRLPAAIAGRNVWAGQVENEDGSMLFANVASLAVGRAGAFQLVTPARGLPAVAVTSAVRARDGSIWVGTIQGLYRFPYPFRMEQWKSQHGLVWSFARAGDRIVAGTSAGVAYLDEDRQWSVFQGSRGFGSISSVLPDSQGNIYAAVSREGVIQLSPDGSLTARTPVGEGARAETLVRTADGQVWVAGAGIYRLRKRGASLSLDPEDLPGDRASAGGIALDKRRGDLWACSADGLIHREAGTWRLITRRGELPERSCISLAIQSDGDVWLGYPGLRSLALVHPGPAAQDRVRLFQSGPEAGDAIGFFLDPDARGWVWRGSGDGIHIVEPSQAKQGAWLHLNEMDGLTELDANRRSFFSDSDGSVWWAAQASIVHFSPPPDLVRPASPPPIFVSAFSMNGGAPKLAETFRDFPHGQRLMAHIGSLQFVRRNAVRVRYRLVPEQTEWRESRVLDLDLGTPRWGTHTLELQSRFSVGQWSGTYTRPLTVLRPWWFSWQAILGFAGIGFGGVASGVAWRRQVQARGNTRLPDLSNWRLAALSPESQWVGTTLDRRYEVLSLVARGGFAAVLKGRDLRHRGRPCAIKIFRHEVLDQDWLTHRFQQEVSALEQIRHPSVVSIYGHGLTPAGAPYLVMEFIEGGTLRDLLDAGALPTGRAASLLRQAAGALEQIHARGIYHRDLKPENLMIRAGSPSGEELVLIDFSIAIVKEPDQTIHGLSRAAGTIYYMAPEQAVGFAIPASDIYSLSKILLEMLTGQRLSTLLPNAGLDLPDRVRELARGLPIRFSEQSLDLLAAALEFDPTRRPQDAQGFAEPIVRDLLSTGHL
jgi:ligand-binding sensor domain-containing protein/tRNA A-37 threonylcarbamoyl transferase component Bud32